MKVYLFNPQNGLFEGEAFENPDSIKYIEGMTPIPPPTCEQGNIPVFDCMKNAWAVIPLTIASQLLNGTTSEFTEKKS
ncbi:MAG: hypothetical protein PHY09_15815 [Desulfuromonadaceae bacterium]|nr:hypothetical protein [Desulfuromonadaceae bacterium]